MENTIYFIKPTLFIEFFVRAYVFHGKGTVRTKLPPDAFFYTGKSKAINRSIQPSYLLAFEKNKPYLSKNILDKEKDKIFNENTNIVASISEESINSKNLWYLESPKLISNKVGINGNKGQLPYHNFASIAPYGFNVLDIDQNEVIMTNFPRKEVILKIPKGHTVCFLCQRLERGDGEWYSPNINLVLFVKNYGLFDKIDIIAQADISRIASNKFIFNDKFEVRDFRKSSLNFELG